MIIGAGIAGAVAALTLAPRPVLLLDAAPPGRQAASQWAQGGLAAAVGGDDSPASHAADTLAVGGGLTDAVVTTRITAEGPASVAMLEEFGVRFDRAASGEFALGLEAAHSHRRILHIRDATGAAILDALSARIDATPSITRQRAFASRLLVENGAIVGVLLSQDGKPVVLPTRAVILATGGVGGLWASTTNPIMARGAGLVLAARAGAMLADLEFVQFHPTALAVGGDPMKLISEAVRGEGAVLVNGDGVRFMAGVQGGDLAARDVVARAVFQQWSEGGSAALDVRHWPPAKFAERFPTIYRVLFEQGLDPAIAPIPVRPAAHYHMGGVRADAAGKTSIEGLWACGEVASTGLHGANRLASNSLLEAVVCGRLAAQDVAGMVFTAAVASPTVGDLPNAGPADAQTIAAMRAIMDANVGVVRNADGMQKAVTELTALHGRAIGTTAADPIAAALLIALAAERRHESRGAHWRSDATAPTEPPAHSSSQWRELEALGISA